MADRFWTGTGNWSNTANWSSSSGGAGGASVPTTTDNAIFDAASGSGTCTVDATANCQDLTLTGFTGTLTGSSFQINAYGNVTFSPSTGTFSLTQLVVMRVPSGTVELKPNGQTFTAPGGVSFFGSTGSLIKLMGDLTLPGSFTVTSGQVDCNDFNVTSTLFAANTAQMVWMRSGLFTITSSGNAFIAASAALTCGTSTIRLTNNSTGNKTVNVGGATLNKVENATGGTGQLRFTAACTINSLDIAATGAANTRNIRVTAGVTVTLGEMKKSVGTGHTLSSVVATSQHTLSCPSGTNYIGDTAISWSNATGGATWIADTGKDSGNNTGWAFTGPPAAPATAEARALIMA